MSAIKLISDLESRGVRLSVSSDCVHIDAPKGVVRPRDLEVLRQHKAEIIAWLVAPVSDWAAQDWQIFFGERAGIAEHDGGMSRIDAEVAAYEFCVVEWMNRNPASSDPDICAWCDQTEKDSVIVPFGTETHGHVWLHSDCWKAWSEVRRERAREALAGFGVAETHGAEAPNSANR